MHTELRLTACQKMNILDAKLAVLALLTVQRTRGRMELFTAIADLWDVAVPRADDLPWHIVGTAPRRKAVLRASR